MSKVDILPPWYTLVMMQQGSALVPVPYQVVLI